MNLNLFTRIQNRKSLKLKITGDFEIQKVRSFQNLIISSNDSIFEKIENDFNYYRTRLKLLNQIIKTFMNHAERNLKMLKVKINFTY